MAPTLVASYFVKTASPSAAALTTPSFTPSNGEILIVKAETWDTGTSMGTPTGGSQTYTSRAAVAPGGFRPWVGIWTAVIAGSPGSMTVSATPSASARCSMVVERWSGAQLAASPVVASGNGGTGGVTGAANLSITTAAAGSVVSWVAGDAQSLDPATRAYLSSATDEGVRDDHVGSNGVGYHAWQSAPSAGSQAFGLSAPTGTTTGMQWCIAGIEVQAAAGGTGHTGAAAATATATLTPAATHTRAAAVSFGVTATATPAATRGRAVAVATAATVELQSAAARTRTGATTSTVTARLGAETTGSKTAAIAATVTGTLAVALTQLHNAAVTLAATARLVATVASPVGSKAGRLASSTSAAAASSATATREARSSTSAATAGSTTSTGAARSATASGHLSSSI